MKYRFYAKTHEAWSAMLEAIEGSKKSIYLESFILVDDEQTRDFFKFLLKKAKEGVTVKIVADRIGNFFWGGFNRIEFEKAGAEVLFFDRWFYHNHRKILIVDEEVGFIGGVNIKGEYFNWLDLHMRVTGKFLVKVLLKSFSRVYYLAGGRDSRALLFMNPKRFRHRVALHKAKVWLIERWPIRGRLILRQYYTKKCNQATKHIIIVTPYFIPPRWLEKALMKAARRGVKIEIVLPKQSDHWLADVANYVVAEKFHDRFRFLFISEMNHAKVLLIDDREGLVGSNNIDAQSFDFNLEASLIFQRRDMVGDLRKILERWKEQAVSYEVVKNRLRWYHRFFGFFIKLIIPIS